MSRFAFPRDVTPKHALRTTIIIIIIIVIIIYSRLPEIHRTSNYPSRRLRV